MKKVAILGFGPSALFATIACNERDIVPDIFSTERAINVAGAFYLHMVPAYCDDWSLKKYEIRYAYEGIEQKYLQKQWGNPFGESSWGKHKIELGYNPREVSAKFYERCRYSEIFNPIDLKTIQILANKYDIIFCSIVVHNRTFKIIPISVEPSKVATINTIIYDGYSSDVVRISHLFGFTYTEYVDNSYVSAHIQEAPIFHVRDIPPQAERGFTLSVPDNVFFIGRNARYDKNELAHDAYGRVRDELRRII
jgi:hypothetical protein